MIEQQCLPKVSVAYDFVRSKDVHEENGELFITLFARLTREITVYDPEQLQSQRECIWVDIDELKFDDASEKVKNMPNSIQTFVLQEEVFNELVQKSQECPKELYFVTPLHEKTYFH